MAVIQTNLRCELQEAVKVQYLNGVLFSQDNQANQINVAVYEGGEPASISGSVTANVIRSDGGTVAVSDGTITDNVASISLPSAAYYIPGVISIVVKITADSVITTIAAVVANVYRSSTDTAIDPGTIIPSIQTLIASIETAVASIPADYSSLWTSLAPAFNASKSDGYKIGEYVTYNGGVYRFKNPHSGSWSASDVDSVSIGGDLYENLTSKRTERIELNPFARYKYSNDGLSVVDFATMPLNSYCYAQFSVLKTALANAGFPLSWADADYCAMIKRAVSKNTVQLSVIEVYNFTKKEKAEMLYYPSSSTNKYRWILPTTDLTKQYFPPDAKTVGDALALKASISQLYSGRNTTDTTIKPIGYYSLNDAGISELDFRDMPANTYAYVYYSAISSGFSDTNPPYSWDGTDVVMIKKWEGSTQNNNTIIDLYNVTKTEKAELLYIDSSSTNKYRWLPMGRIVNNSYTYNQYENSYEVTATPSITTDTNNYLASTGNNTDRTSDIVTMLNTTGVCNLGPGYFYVSGIDMPDGSILRGSGNSTRIVLLSSVTSGYAIKMGSRCTVEDVMIMGSTSSPTITSTVGTRHGILWQGTYVTVSGSGTAPTRGTISNCIIMYFEGGGITCYGTGGGISNCLNVANTFIAYCTVGVNIAFISEFHRFTNVDCRGCYYGCIDNGGNNVFSNCGFSKNEIGLYMDNSNSQSPNNSHGSFTNCVFNHSGLAVANSGTSIKIDGCANGEMFVGCQIFYGITDIKDSYGIVFDSCNYGNGSSAPVINIDGGGLVMFNGCCFGNVAPTITKTNNTATKAVNSFLRDGTAVTVS